MNVIRSEEFDKQLRQVRSAQMDLYPSLKEVVRILQNLRPENLTSRSVIHRLAGATEDIYVMRYGDLRFFFTVRGDDVLLIGIKNIRINVSRGQPLNFAANGNPVSGIIVASEK